MTSAAASTRSTSSKQSQARFHLIFWSAIIYYVWHFASFVKTQTSIVWSWLYLWGQWMKSLNPWLGQFESRQQPLLAWYDWIVANDTTVITHHFCLLRPLRLCIYQPVTWFKVPDLRLARDHVSNSSCGWQHTTQWQCRLLQTKSIRHSSIS